MRNDTNEGGEELPSDYLVRGSEYEKAPNLRCVLPPIRKPDFIQISLNSPITRIPIFVLQLPIGFPRAVNINLLARLLHPAFSLFRSYLYLTPSYPITLTSD